MNKNFKNSYQISKDRYYQLKNLSGGTKGKGEKEESNLFKCESDNKFKEICLPYVKDVDKGKTKYQSFDACMEKCPLFLTKKQFMEEYATWMNFLKKIMDIDCTDEKCKIYAKGGTVLGIKVLKEILNQNNDENLTTNLDKFFNMNLIKDWDFTMSASDEVFKNKIRSIMEEYGISVEGQSMKIVRLSQDRMMLKKDALFEMSIKEDEHNADLELPMTTMKILLTKENIRDIFIIAKHIFDYMTKNITLEPELIKYFIKDIDVLIPEYTEDGLFKGNPQDVEGLGLSEKLKNVIKQASNNDDNVIRFLTSHIIQPDRMFVRLIEKNLAKSRKIKEFYNDLGITIPDWLIKEENINKLKQNFLENLKISINLLVKDEVSLSKQKLDEYYKAKEDELLLGKLITYLNIKDKEQVPITKKEEAKKELIDNNITSEDLDYNEFINSLNRKYKFNENLKPKDTLRELASKMRSYTSDIDTKIKYEILIKLQNFYNNVNIGRLGTELPKESLDQIKEYMLPELDPYLSDRIRGINPSNIDKEYMDKLVPNKDDVKKITVLSIF